MSYGGYEARVGTPKLLELLDQLDLKATFFVTADRWMCIRRWRRPFSGPAMRSAIMATTICCRIRRSWIEEELERGLRR